MTTLIIDGKKVTVSDNFLSMTPEEQNRTVDEIAQSIKAGQVHGVQSSAPATEPRWAQNPALPKWQEPPPIEGGTATFQGQPPDTQFTEAQLKDAARKALAAGDTAAAKRLVDAARKVGAATGGEPIRAQTYDGAMGRSEFITVQTPNGPVRFPKGMSRAEMDAALNKLPKPAPQEPQTVPATPMPPNAELQRQGPGPTGFIDPALYEMGAIGRRYAQGQPSAQGDGMSLDEGRAALSETWQNPAPPISQGRSAIVGASQGATFGFADEIVGGLLALHPRIDYDTARDYLRDEVDTAREFYPKTTLAGEIAGAVAMPGKTAANFINKGTTTAARMGRGAIAGATGGAATGFGSGEGGMENRTVNAALGGTAGALGGAALVGLGQGFNKVLDMVSKRPELREAAPTLAGLRDEAGRLYEDARSSGAVIPESAVKQMTTGIQAMLRNSGFDADLHPRVQAVIKRLTTEKGNKSLAEIEILRRVAGNAAESIAPDERRLAAAIIDRIDDTIDEMGEGGAAMKAARETWGRLRRMEAIEAAIERAGLAKANFASALQSEFRTLVKSPRKMRGFSAAERAEIAKIARGGPVTASLQALGAALSPSRPLGAVVAGGTAFGFGPGALALPATGLAANKIADALVKRGGRKVAEAVGSSDARRAIVEALARKPNPLAAVTPGANYIPGALGTYLAGQ